MVLLSAIIPNFEYFLLAKNLSRFWEILVEKIIDSKRVFSYKVDDKQRLNLHRFLTKSALFYHLSRFSQLLFLSFDRFFMYGIEELLHKFLA